MTPIWKQARQFLNCGGRFQQPQGWAFSAKEKAWMFDNEIDWVTRLEMLPVRREARERRKILNTFEYKAEHKQSG